MKIRFTQIQMLLKGGRVLVVVSEPPPSTLDEKTVLGETRADCEKNLRKDFQMQLANSQFPYELYLLNPSQFKTYHKEFLKPSDTYIKNIRSVDVQFKLLSLPELVKIVPEALVPVTMAEF